MKVNIFTIFDNKAGAYSPPFALPTVPMAVRYFADCCNAPDHQYGKHPEDYSIFSLGTFDQRTATFDLADKTALHTGNELIVPKE